MTYRDQPPAWMVRETKEALREISASLGDYYPPGDGPPILEPWGPAYWKAKPAHLRPAWVKKLLADGMGTIPMGYDPETNTVSGGCNVGSWGAIQAEATKYARRLGKPPPVWVGGGIMGPTDEQRRAAGRQQEQQMSKRLGSLGNSYEAMQQVERDMGKQMLKRLQKATFHLANSYHMNFVPDAVRGLRDALARAKAIFARESGDGFVDIVEAIFPNQRPVFPPDTIIARLQRTNGTIGVTWLPRITPVATSGALSGPLTEFVCSDTQAGQMLATAVNEAVDQGAQAAAVGAAIAGAVGGMLEKPVQGAIAGAFIGYVAHFLWTNPYRR